MELEGELRQWIERREAPPAQMIREIELMQRRAPELYYGLQCYAESTRHGTEER